VEEKRVGWRDIGRGVGWVKSEEENGEYLSDRGSEKGYR